VAAGLRLIGWWRLAALLALTSGCTMVSPDKRSAYQYDHPLAVSDRAFLRSLDAFGNAMVGGNRAEILNNGDEIVPAMVAAIREAKLSVDLEAYVFKNDRAGAMIAEPLMDAARRGVEVRVLVDGTGSGRSGPLLDRMRKAGVKAYVYHPIRLWSLYKIARRTHRNILVVDGAVNFTGGFRIADRWLGNARNPKEWRDIMVRTTGPVTAQMQAIFSEDWTYTTGEILAGERFYPPIAPAGGALAQAVKMTRGDPSSLAKMLYFVAIKSARKSIFIQNAYFVPDGQIRQALSQAAQRGVDVRIMVPGRSIDVPVVRMASRRHYGELLQAGVRIFEYDRSMMHTKEVVVDGIFTTIGTINFDARSLRENAEESVAFYDRDIAARMEANFAADERICHEVTYESWKRRGIEMRLAELASAVFQPIY